MRSQIPDSFKSSSRIHSTTVTVPSTRQTLSFPHLRSVRRARELAYRYGSMLERKQPLGWKDSQALVVFYNTVPNNSLPILYKTGLVNHEVPWYPLFPR